MKLVVLIKDAFGAPNDPPLDTWEDSPTVPRVGETILPSEQFFRGQTWIVEKVSWFKSGVEGRLCVVVAIYAQKKEQAR